MLEESRGKIIGYQTPTNQIPLAQLLHTLWSEAAQLTRNKVKVPTMRSEEPWLLSGAWVPKNNILGQLFLS